MFRPAGGRPFGLPSCAIYPRRGPWARRTIRLGFLVGGIEGFCRKTLPTETRTAPQPEDHLGRPGSQVRMTMHPQRPSVVGLGGRPVRRMGD